MSESIRLTNVIPDKKKGLGIVGSIKTGLAFFGLYFLMMHAPEDYRVVKTQLVEVQPPATLIDGVDGNTWCGDYYEKWKAKQRELFAKEQAAEEMGRAVAERNVIELGEEIGTAKGKSASLTVGKSKRVITR